MSNTTDDRMSAQDFDAQFDSGESIIDSLAVEHVESVSLVPKKVNIDMPQWMVMSLDKEAKRIGTSRQALIKMWLAQNLETLENKNLSS